MPHVVGQPQQPQQVMGVQGHVVVGAVPQSEADLRANEPRPKYTWWYHNASDPRVCICGTDVTCGESCVRGVKPMQAESI